MRDIDSQIICLKREIEVLEMERERGFSVFQDSWSTYKIEGHHTLLYGLGENVFAIIVDEDVVRKYLAEKDSKCLSKK